MSADSEANRPRDMADGASDDMGIPRDPEGDRPVVPQGDMVGAGDSEGERSGVRVGSPFAVGESAADAGHATPDMTVASVLVGEAAWENGPIRYTAVGALWASAIVTGFTAVAAWSFPEGAFAVATLGCGLAIFAFASGHRLVPTMLLVIHLAFFTHTALEIWR